MNIPFSPPDISDEEINEVVDTLRSGWITTGPKTKLFESKIAELCHTSKAVCLNSATAALELTLRVLGIGPGDEVIVPSYTYTASASPVYHVGAKIVMVDIEKDTYHIDYAKLNDLINEKTKAIIAVDIAGIIENYDEIRKVVDQNKDKFVPNNDIQKLYNRIIVIADSAHGLGAMQNGKKAGEIADFTTFSFHAVKNLTTGEGGAATWVDVEGLDNEKLYKEPGTVKERFTTPAKCSKNIIETKIIVRGNLASTNFFIGHCCIANNNPTRTVFCSGDHYIKMDPFHLIDYSVASLNHYYSKSTEEFIKRKSIGRLDIPSRSFYDALIDFINAYYNINERTTEKDKMFEDALNKLK